MAVSNEARSDPHPGGCRVAGPADQEADISHGPAAVFHVLFVQTLQNAFCPKASGRWDWGPAHEQTPPFPACEGSVCWQEGLAPSAHLGRFVLCPSLSFVPFLSMSLQ